MKKRILTETNINKERNNEDNANENTSALINITQEDNSNIFELLQNLWKKQSSIYHLKIF